MAEVCHLLSTCPSFDFLGHGVRIYIIYTTLPCVPVYVYCTQGGNISRGWRPMEIFTTEGTTYTVFHKE